MKRRYFIPEVIQTSAMDCGPACLKALFGGFDIYLSYGRLREACQTDVDGTSIDTIEGLAGQLGMAAEQSMLPSDYVLLTNSARLPAIVVVTLPDGGTHFVVLWRIHGAWVQVMDPAVGRVWMPRERFLQSLYLHEHEVPVDEWSEWSRSDEYRRGIEQRIRDLGVASDLWPDPAHQDAALRLVGSLRAAGKLRNRPEIERLLSLCAAHPEEIPSRYWTARPSARHAEHVTLRGAVLITAAGPTNEPRPGQAPASLERVLSEPPPRLWSPIVDSLRSIGWVLPAIVATALIAAAAGGVLEALLFRGLFDVGRHLQSTSSRLGALSAVLVLLTVLLALDWPGTAALLRLGRALEIGLRVRFLLKIPLLGDRYFQSRLLSDMAQRAHGLQQLRQVPEICGHLLQLVASLLVTGLAIAWLYPGSALLVALAMCSALVVPALFLPGALERDLRQRELGASLASLQLDCLLAARAIQAHDAQQTLRAVQAELLRGWLNAGLRRQSLFVRADAIQMALGFACVIALIYRQMTLVASPAGSLLLIYWALSIPLLGQDLATALRELPALRNTLLRFLEPIGSPEEDLGTASARPGAGGVRISFESVSVVLAGRPVLEDITLAVEPGEQVAIVGASGAGKSSLVGCLLGWHPPTGGTLRIDDATLDCAAVAQLRRETAWIDPQVYLFDTTLLDNLRYGNSCEAGRHIGTALASAGLAPILKHRPDGLQTNVGEGGMRLSGGEGQRVRAARALGRSDARLVILDEPTRGLGRTQRRRMLTGLRRHYAGATLFCVTHDVADTLDFDRVLVIEQGRIREQGSPVELRARPGSRYEQLLQQERSVAGHLWAHPGWRRVRIRTGRLREQHRQHA